MLTLTIQWINTYFYPRKIGVYYGWNILFRKWPSLFSMHSFKFPANICITFWKTWRGIELVFFCNVYCQFPILFTNTLSFRYPQKNMLHKDAGTLLTMGSYHFWKWVCWERIWLKCPCCNMRKKLWRKDPVISSAWSCIQYRRKL